MTQAICLIDNLVHCGKIAWSRFVTSFILCTVVLVTSDAVFAQQVEEKEWLSFKEFERVYAGIYSPIKIKSLYADYQIYQNKFFILELKLQEKEQYYLAKQLPKNLVKRLVEAYRQANYPLLVQDGIKEQATFFGDRCTLDCSGHFAGYEWAAVNQVDFFSECYGQSPSFNKGCEMFLDGY